MRALVGRSVWVPYLVRKFISYERRTRTSTPCELTQDHDVTQVGAITDRLIRSTTALAVVAVVGVAASISYEWVTSHSEG